MRLVYLTLITICTFSFFSTAQVVLIDDFESYDLTFLVPQADHWRNWGLSQEGVIVGTYNGSSQLIGIDGSGIEDVLLLIPGQPQTETHAVQWDMLIPTDSGGYFNMQGAFTPNNTIWELHLNGGNVYFNQDGFAPGIGSIDGTPGQSFEYPEDEWFTIKNVYNLDEKIWAMYINDVLQFADQQLDFAGNNFAELAAIDFFSVDSNNEYYLDNVVLEILPLAGIDDHTSQKISAFPNPVMSTLNLTSTEAISSITILNMLGQEVFKNRVNNALEISIDTSNLASGVYFVKITIEGAEQIIKVIKE